MPGRWRGATLASFGVVAALLVARTSRADVTKDACIDANAKAQDLRRDHKLSAAREQLTLCSDAACPALVRGDCARLLADLVQAQPSVVFDVATPSGAIVPGARVTVDGKRLPDGERSRALTLDPGPHSVTFEAAGFAPRTQTVVMLEGDKGHHEHIVLTPAATEAVPEAELQANADRASAARLRLIGLVGGGVGLAGVAVGSVFGALTLSEMSAQESVCKVACSASAHAQALGDHSSGITDGAVSTVGFIAGGLLVAAGATIYWKTRPPVERPAPIAIRLAPSLGPGGGALLLRGEF